MFCLNAYGAGKPRHCHNSNIGHNINHLLKVCRYSKATIFQDNNILKKSSNYLEGF